jgi:hypothetical protein
MTTDTDTRARAPHDPDRAGPADVTKGAVRV